MRIIKIKNYEISILQLLKSVFYIYKSYEKIMKTLKMGYMKVVTNVRDLFQLL